MYHGFVAVLQYHIITRLPRDGTPVSPSIRPAPKDLGATTHFALNDLWVGRRTTEGHKHNTTRGEGLAIIVVNAHLAVEIKHSSLCSVTVYM